MLTLFLMKTSLNRLRTRPKDKLLQYIITCRYRRCCLTTNSLQPGLKLSPHIKYLTMDERRRSRSPGQERPRKTGGGFRWKDKRRDNDSGAGGDERRLERGYRDRSDRPRSPRRERERDAGRQEDRHRDSEWGRGRTERDEKEERRQRKREKRERQAMQAAQSSEPMIVVNVNDRLGTKAAIPCLASDPISMFPVHLPVILCQVSNLFCRAIQSTGSRAHRT